MVKITGFGESECIWCGKSKEGVEVATDDRSFVGFLCMADLKRMLRLKSAAGNGKPVEAK